MNDQDVEILLVEDNANDAEMTIRALRKNNIANHVLRLKDGAEALDYIFATGEFASRNILHKPKLIILDLKMPKVDGIEVLKNIRNNQITKNIPVVVLSSSKEDPDIEKCYSYGVNSYVVKPMRFDNYIKTVSELGIYWLLLNQSPN